MGREEGGRVATPGGDDVLIWPAPQSRKPANDRIRSWSPPSYARADTHSEACTDGQCGGLNSKGAATIQ